jgi:hypothetical protein
LEVTPEGWIVDDLRSFRILVDHSPPRPYRLLDILRYDVRSWRVWCFWIVGGGFLSGGLLIGAWPIAGLGAYVLIRWLGMLRTSLRYLRNAPARVGTIDAVQDLHPHPLLREYSMAVAHFADGPTLRVAVPTKFAAPILGGHGRAEVLILHDSKRHLKLGCSFAFGARPIPKPQETPCQAASPSA